MEMFWKFLDAFIILPYLASFIFLSYKLRTPLSDLTKKIIAGGMHRTYSVFVIAFFVGIPFYLMGEYHATQFIVTYTFGTSFYELIIQKVVDKLEKVKDAD